MMRWGGTMKKSHVSCSNSPPKNENWDLTTIEFFKKLYAQKKIKEVEDIVRFMKNLEYPQIH